MKEITLDDVIKENDRLLGKTRCLTITGVPDQIDGQQNELASQDLIRQWANAIGDTNPLWLSEDYAGNTIHGGIIAPPTFLTCIACPTTGVRLRVPGIVGFNAGTRWERFHEVRTGEIFRVLETYDGIEIKNKEPPLWVLHITRKYINQMGHITAITHSKLNELLVSTPEIFQKWKHVPGTADVKGRYRYTDDELNTIIETQMNEERRGTDPLFWEDIIIGEELKPVVKGPVDIMETGAFLGAWGGIRGCGLMEDAYATEPTYGIRDPERMLTYPDLCVYTVDDLARKAGLSVAIILPSMIQAWIGHFVTNWMGDYGFLRVLNCEPERISPQGHTYWVKGKILDKHIEDNDHLVNISAHVEDEEGIVHVVAQATVYLMSRSLHTLG